jgi:hypothetical protein
MKPKMHLYACTLAVLLLLGCDKGPDLTPVTQEGKNTFSCKVNGKVWIPDGNSDLFVTIRPIAGGFTKNIVNDTINIYIYTRKSNGEGVDLYLRSAEPGIHSLNYTTRSYEYSFYPHNYGSFRRKDGHELITSAAYSGWVKLTTANVVSGIIAGTFEFTAGNPQGESVRITEGRFDVNSSR